MHTKNKLANVSWQTRPAQLYLERVAGSWVFRSGLNASVATSLNLCLTRLLLLFLCSAFQQGPHSPIHRHELVRPRPLSRPPRNPRLRRCRVRYPHLRVRGQPLVARIPLSMLAGVPTRRLHRGNVETGAMAEVKNFNVTTAIVHGTGGGGFTNRMILLIPQQRVSCAVPP